MDISDCVRLYCVKNFGAANKKINQAIKMNDKNIKLFKLKFEPNSIKKWWIKMEKTNNRRVSAAKSEIELTLGKIGRSCLPGDGNLHFCGLYEVKMLSICFKAYKLARPN